MKSKIQLSPFHFHKLFIIILLIVCESCYHTRVTTSNFDPSTTYSKKTICSWFWGLAQRDVVATNCDSLKLKSIDEVRVTTNLGYSIINVVTLGICCPLTIEWKCPKPCPREGEIQ